VKRVLTAAILIPFVILALFRAPLWLFTLLVLGVALLAAKEYFDIAEKTGFRPLRTIGYVVLVLSFAISFGSIGMDVAFLSTAESWMVAIAGLLLLVAFIFLLASMLREPLSNALPDAAVSYLLLPYVGLTLGSFPILRSGRNGALFLLYLMLLVWCGDIAAYYVGRAIGKHKLAPRISPGKTWEGSIASVVGAVIAGVLLFHYINPIASTFRSVHLLAPTSVDLASTNSKSPVALELAPLWFVAVFAVCVNIAAQLGDLVESALKRGAGMKDSGSLLPGHGGVLDRIDALLFALPVGLIFIYVAGMARYFS